MLSKDRWLNEYEKILDDYDAFAITKDEAVEQLRGLGFSARKALDIVTDWGRPY